MSQLKPLLLDVEAIARHYKVAAGSVRRWASEDRWKPYGTRHRRLWDLNDAQVSYERRRRSRLDKSSTSGEYSVS